LIWITESLRALMSSLGLATRSATDHW